MKHSLTDDVMMFVTCECVSYLEATVIFPQAKWKSKLQHLDDLKLVLARKVRFVKTKEQ